MLNLEVKLDAVEQRFESMLERVHTFGQTDMPQGLTDWQTQDMRRRYPETEVTQLADNNDVSASTTIYPRSRTYEQTHPRRDRLVIAKRKPTLSSMPRLQKTATTNRPILRAELLVKLYERMAALMSEKITWR